MLLGLASCQVSHHDFLEDLAQEEINLTRRETYSQNLLKAWWNLYYIQVFPYLLPFRRYKDTKRLRNFQVDDVCFLKYDGKVQPSYRLCKVVNILPSDEFNTAGGRVIRTLEVALNARSKCDKLLPYKAKQPEVRPRLGQTKARHGN